MTTKDLIKQLPFHYNYKKFRWIQSYESLCILANVPRFDNKMTIEQILCRIPHRSIAFDNGGWLNLSRNGRIILSRSGLIKHKTKHDKPVVISEYKVSRHYGGSEEGGWWYDWWTHVKSSRPMRFCRALRMQHEMQIDIDKENKKFRRRNRFSMAGGEDTVVTWESYGGQSATKHKPHYE